jgi:hypothetical protein
LNTIYQHDKNEEIENLKYLIENFGSDKSLEAPEVIKKLYSG